MTDGPVSQETHPPFKASQPHPELCLRRLSRQDYTVAWICALPDPEWKASIFMFDDPHDDVRLPRGSQYQYAYGTINGHNVVMGCLPQAQIGKSSAAAVLAEMLVLFPQLEFGLMVGIGGGIHSAKHNIRLGDVVVSQPDRSGRHGGVVQYDYGKFVADGAYEQMGVLSMPSKKILSTLGKINAMPMRTQDIFESYVASFDRYRNRWTGEPEFAKPETADILFPSGYVHQNEKDTTCSDCNADAQVIRKNRSSVPMVHQGLILCGDSVIKNASKRDQLVEATGGEAICLEMESAGVVEQLSCVVIRGICDYADSHKHKDWQPYAAATASSWAKAFLRNIAPYEDADLDSQHESTNVEKSESNTALPVAIRSKSRHLDRLRSASPQNKWSGILTKPSVFTIPSDIDLPRVLERMSPYEPSKVTSSIRDRRFAGSNEWIFESTEFLRWKHNPPAATRTLLLHGTVGSGKTFAMENIIHHLESTLQDSSGTIVLHYFFKYGDTSDDFMRSLAKQLIQHLGVNQDLYAKDITDILFTAFGDDNRLPSRQELLNSILVPLLRLTEKVVICIDGKDECTLEEQDRMFEDLAEVLQSKPAYVLVSSQENLTVSRLSGDHFSITLNQEHSSTDISAYIASRLARLALPGRILEDAELFEYAQAELLTKSHGMFLWVCLQVELIEHCDTANEVKEMLQGLPTDLEILYERCYERTRYGKPVVNEKLLRWVCVARIPMTMKQLKEALAVDPASGQMDAQAELSTESIVRGGVSLLSIGTREDHVIPIHHSVRNFVYRRALKSDSSEFWSLRHAAVETRMRDHAILGSSIALFELTEVSLAHITHCTTRALMRQELVPAPPVRGLIPAGVTRALRLQQPGKDVMLNVAHLRPGKPDHRTHFLDYAIRSWPVHTSDTSSLFADSSMVRMQTVRHQFKEITSSPNKTWNLHPWSQSTQATDMSHRQGWLAYAVINRHMPLLNLLVDDIRLRTGAGSKREQIREGKDLLNKVLIGNEMLPALHFACKTGRAEVALFLLDHCLVDVKCPLEQRTPLHYAAQCDAVDVVHKIVLTPRMKPDEIDKSGMTPLMLAAQAGAERTVHYLLSKGANVNARDTDGHSPLYWAVFGKHIGASIDLAKASTREKLEDDEETRSLLMRTTHAALRVALRQSLPTQYAQLIGDRDSSSGKYATDYRTEWLPDEYERTTRRGLLPDPRLERTKAPVSPAYAAMR